MQPVLILLYHHCNTQSYIKKRPDKKLFVADDVFCAQLQWLKENYSIITLDDMGLHNTSKTNLTEPSIVITFDDGHRDNYQFAFEISKKLDVPLTIYLTSGWIELPSWQWRAEVFDLIQSAETIKLFDENMEPITLHKLTEDGREIYSHIASKLVQLAPYQRRKLIDKIVKLNGKTLKDRQQEFLSWKQIREMRNTGLISIGAHTATHPMLSTLTEAEAFDEIYKSKKTIESHLREKVKHFAYPYGGGNAASQREFNLAEKAGFYSATTTVAPSQLVDEFKQNCFSLCRLSVDGRWSMLEFQKRVTEEVEVLCE